MLYRLMISVMAMCLMSVPVSAQTIGAQGLGRSR